LRSQSGSENTTSSTLSNPFERTPFVIALFRRIFSPVLIALSTFSVALPKIEQDDGKRWIDYRTTFALGAYFSATLTQVFYTTILSLMVTREFSETPEGVGYLLGLLKGTKVCRQAGKSERLVEKFQPESFSI
jgi:hypothetical protein